MKLQYLFAAYTFIWLVIFGYLWFLHSKLAALKKEIAILRESIEKR